MWRANVLDLLARDHDAFDGCDACAHRLTQDLLGNTDHADIVHCRVSGLIDDAVSTGEAKRVRLARAPVLGWHAGAARHDVRSSNCDIDVAPSANAIHQRLRDRAAGDRPAAQRAKS